MTHPLPEDTLALSSLQAGADAVSNRQPYRPPFLAVLHVNSQTRGSGKPNTNYSAEGQGNYATKEGTS